MAKTCNFVLCLDYRRWSTMENVICFNMGTKQPIAITEIATNACHQRIQQVFVCLFNSIFVFVNSFGTLSKYSWREKKILELQLFFIWKSFFFFFTRQIDVFHQQATWLTKCSTCKTNVIMVCAQIVEMNQQDMNCVVVIWLEHLP